MGRGENGVDRSRRGRQAVFTSQGEAQQSGDVDVGHVRLPVDLRDVEREGRAVGRREPLPEKPRGPVVVARRVVDVRPVDLEDPQKVVESAPGRQQPGAEPRSTEHESEGARSREPSSQLPEIARGGEVSRPSHGDRAAGRVTEGSSAESAASVPHELAEEERIAPGADLIDARAQRGLSREPRGRR